MGFLDRLLTAVSNRLEDSTSIDDNGDGDSSEPVEQSDFEAAVKTVAPRYGVASINFTGPSSVKLMFWPNSHKRQWDGYLDFDLEAGKFTASSTSSYGSPKPNALGYAVLRELGL